MKAISLNYSNVLSYVSQKDITDYILSSTDVLEKVKCTKTEGSDVLGWFKVCECANEKLIEQICHKAEEIRKNADVFLVIGVGGSNQGARAVIEALGNVLNKDNKSPLVLYAGNNLSPIYINRILEQLKGKSVYVNVIAKNFATLEPGITFRIVRKYMEDMYGAEGSASRIIATASLNNSSLEQLAESKGYSVMPFPLDVGGRFSVLTAVGLLPIAVTGMDISKLVLGASDMEKHIKSEVHVNNPAVLYAVIRNLLLSKGYHIEILAHFEPLLAYFTKWWIQLLGESEGKEGKGIFPSSCSFSEDLHSMGQYIQQGKRILFETFLRLENQGACLNIHAEKDNMDLFGYLDNKDFADLNNAAFEAAVNAHSSGGVPCMVIDVPEMNEYYFGQLFYFFEYACYISGSLLGVNPFDQPGVEDYKENMFRILGKQ